MTDPELWARLGAVPLPQRDGRDLFARIEAGMNLHPGHGAVLFQEYLALIYLEALAAKLGPKRPQGSQLLIDFGAWLAWDDPELFRQILRAGPVPDRPKAPAMTLEETRELFARELGRLPVPQVWPRQVFGPGQRRPRTIAASLIVGVVSWRAIARLIQGPGEQGIPLWVPGAIAVLAAAAVYLLAPRQARLDPPDAWAEDEAKSGAA